ncbi:DUF1924 domain-containing protein [Sphingopyxis terrae]|uniref:DUF1924 domain-containing protein n=1 Tax=Sphingopyxis terrae TaxID=33052 RepID=UPI0039089005
MSPLYARPSVRATNGENIYENGSVADRAGACRCGSCHACRAGRAGRKSQAGKSRGRRAAGAHDAPFGDVWRAEDRLCRDDRRDDPEEQGWRARSGDRHHLLYQGAARSGPPGDFSVQRRARVGHRLVDDGCVRAEARRDPQ